MRERLARIRSVLWAQKYRFQLGQQWLVFVNFALLLVAVSKSMDLRAGPILLVAVPFGFVAMWAWGWFLDVVVKQAQMDEREAIRRSPAMQLHEENNRLIKQLRSDLAIYVKENESLRHALQEKEERISEILANH